jgi:ornithine cyclodeaminase
LRIIGDGIVSQSGAVGIKRAIELVEECFQAKALGEAVCGREVSLKPHGSEGCAFYSWPACHKGLGMAGIKWTSHVRNPSSTMYTKPVILLNDLDTGTPLALVDGYEISASRTGGVTGAALKYLGRQDSERLLCCGAGHQAGAQIRAAVTVLSGLRRVSVWSRGVSRALELCRELEAEYGSSPVFEPTTDFEEPASNADVIIGATSASSPYLYKRHFSDDRLYVHIGMNDVAAEAIRSFDSIVCDDFDAGREGSSQSLFRLYREEPDISKRVILLESFLRKDAAIRPQLGRRIMFNSFGLPIFDLVLAAEAYRYAVGNRLGEETKLNGWDKVITL